MQREVSSLAVYPAGVRRMLPKVWQLLKHASLPSAFEMMPERLFALNVLPWHVHVMLRLLS